MCVINLGADQILSEAMIAGEIVKGVVNIAVSKHSETEVRKHFPLLQSVALHCAGWFDGSPGVSRVDGCGLSETGGCSAIGSMLKSFD